MANESTKPSENGGDDRRSLKVTGPIFDLIRRLAEKHDLATDSLLEVALLAFEDRIDVPYLVEQAMLVREIQQLQLILEQVVHSSYTLAEVVHGLDAAALKGLLQLVQQAKKMVANTSETTNPEGR
jgi:hypothetical protein